MSTAAASLAEELPVRKALGLFACTGFVALGLWLFLPNDAPRNLSAQTGAVQQVTSPGAQPGTAGDVAPSPRAVAPVAPAAVAVPPEAGSPAGNGEASTRASLLKLRIRDQLAMALRALERGDRDEAQRLAMAADQLAKATGLVFAQGETSPQDLLARIQVPAVDDAPSKLAQLIKQAQAAGTAGQFAEAINLAAQADRLARKNNLVPAAGTPRPAQMVAVLEIKLLDQSTGKTGKSLAELVQTRVNDYMVVAAKQEAAGRLSEALRLASVAGLMAQSTQLVFPTGTLTPEALIARVEAAQAPKALSPKATSLKGQATALVAEGRALLRAGKLDEARAKAELARGFQVPWDLLDDRPRFLLQDISKASAAPAAAPTKLANAPREGVARAIRQPNVGSRDPAVGPPTKMSALDLYNQGLAHLRRGDREASYRSFLDAYRSGEKLDRVRSQQLEDFLRELSPRNPTATRTAASEPRPSTSSARDDASAVAQQKQNLLFDSLRSRTLNAVFKARQLKDNDPDKAVETLDQALAAVNAAQLDKALADRLKGQLNNARRAIVTERDLKAPQVAQTKRNREIEAQFEAEQQHKIRVEQEIGELVDKYNELFRDKRYEEAEMTARKAREIDPYNPVVVTMFQKAIFARRNEINLRRREDVDASLWDALNDVEMAMVFPTDDYAYPGKREWKDLVKRRKRFGRPDNRERSEEELRIEKSLNSPVSLHFDEAPLKEVIDEIRKQIEINIVVDKLGLEEVGATTNSPVSIDLNGIKLKSVLNLTLEPLDLDYTIQDDVLKITSKVRQQGRLITATYPVADLVVPLDMG